jgi:cold shock CspA family protein
VVVTGTIKRLMRDKGFGFITVEDGREYFFHKADCQTAFVDLRKDRSSP